MRAACWSMEMALGVTRSNFSRQRQAVCLTPAVESLGREGEGSEGRRGEKGPGVVTYGDPKSGGMSFPTNSAMSLLAMLATHCMARVLKRGLRDSMS